MLLPLFSPDCLLVAWLQPGRFVFDAGMGYCAFVTGGHCWSGASGIWLGPVIDGHLYDIDGRPVAWSPAAPLRATHRPLRPVNAVRAVRPVQPVRPVDPGRPLTAPGVPGGWSILTFRDWLVVNDPRPIAGEEPEEREAVPELGAQSPGAGADPDVVK